MGWMAIGTGATAPAFGNTALGAEIDRNALTSSTDSAQRRHVRRQLGGRRRHQLGDHRGGDLQRRLDGTMLARATFTAINKGASDTLAITWTVTIG